MWRSLVAQLTGGQGAGGSNPLIPTNIEKADSGLLEPAFFVMGKFDPKLYVVKLP